jgi:hypothetical protein
MHAHPVDRCQTSLVVTGNGTGATVTDMNARRKTMGFTE